MRRHVDIDRLSIVSVVIVLLGLGLFALGLMRAVQLSPRFSFTQSFFSELGQTGKRSAMFFNASVVLLGSCVLVFFLNSVRFYGEVLFGLLGTVSAVGLIGVGLTPMNTHFVSHCVCLGVWLLALLAVLLLQSAEAMRNGEYTLPIFAGVLAVLIVAYGASGLGGNAPFFQKLVVATAILWLGIVCWYAIRNAVSITREYVVGHDRQTRSYIDRIASRGMYGPQGKRQDRK